MRKIILLASAATGVMLSAAPAFAQDSSAQDSGASQVAADATLGDDAIVVTARRRAEDVSKVPIAITAFSGEQLAAKGITNTYALTKITPGLNISAGGGKSNPFVVIRAQSKAVTGNGSPGVITYLNDVPLPGYGSNIQTFDMANIQVLKGPQGTLFGRNSIGGALLTVTKAPTHDFGGYVSGEFASHGTHQGEGAINVPVIQDVVALRLAAQVGYEGSDIKTFVYNGYTLANPQPGVYVATPGELNPNGHSNDEYATTSFRASLLLEPTDWFKNVTVGDYSKIRGQNNQTFDKAYPRGINGGNPALYFLPISTIASAVPTIGGIYSGIVQSLAQCPSGAINCNITSAINGAQGSAEGRYNYNTQDPWIARSIIKGITNTTTIKLGDNHQLKNIFAIRTTDSFSNTTLTGIAIPVITTANQVRIKQTTEEIQLAGSFFDNDLKYTLGGFFYNEKPNGPGGYQALEVNSFFGLSHVQGVTYLHNSSKAVYGQVDYSLDKILPGVAVTAGLRQTWDTQGACTTNITYSPLMTGGGMVITSPDNASVIASEAACRAGTATGAQVFADAKFKKLTYTFGANWQITPDAMVYVAHRRGYRAGGYNTPALDPYLSAYQTFRPETLTDWEVGTKLRWRAAGMRGSFDFAAFTGDDTDNQVPISTSQLSGSSATCVVAALGTTGHATSDCLVAGTPGARVPINGQTTTVNAGSITIRGFEAAATVSPIAGLTFGGSLSYVDVTVNSITLDPRLSQVIPASRVPTVATFAVQGQPKWATNFSVTAELPEKVLGGDLSLAVDYHYNAAFRSVELTVPSWFQWDLRLGLANIGDTGLSLSAYVRNLTDELTYVGTGSSSPSGIGLQGFSLGKSRTVGMNLTYKFGS